MSTNVRQGEQQGATSGIFRLTWRHHDQAIHQGDRIEVITRLREPYGTRNPGGFNYGLYLKRQGIHAVATVSGPGKVYVHPKSEIKNARSLWAVADRWRAHIHRAAVSTLSDPALGLFLGMIIGDQSSITPELRQGFMETGTVHIISISGFPI